MRDKLITPKTLIMKNPKKIRFQFLGETFELPSVALREDSYNGKYIHMGAKHTASVIKQYVKKKYGNRLTVWSTSDVYSGGSSVRVNVWSKNGSCTPLTIFQDIQNFAQQFKAGRFDGMYDIYEYRDDEVKSDNGTQFKYFPSYIFVDNKPQWDSVEYWLSQWKGFDPSEYSCTMVGNTTWEQFVNFNSSFWKKGTLEKLNKYMVDLQKELIQLGYTEEELVA
jgi:hypothetical protein